VGPQNLYWLQAVLAAAMALFSSAYLWRHRAKPSARLLMALLMGVAVWAAAYSLECVSQDIGVRLWWVRLEYVGAALLAPTFLAFCLCVAGLERWVSWRRFWPFFIIPLLTVLFAWSNSRHHLLWEQAWLELGGPAPFTAYRRGLWFWVHCTYSHLLFMVGTLFLLRALWRSRRAHGRQLVVAVIGMATAWAVNLLYLLDWEPFRFLDLTPLAFGLLGLFFTLSLFRARLLDLIPLAREALLENLRDPVMVLDRRDRLVDMNPAARAMLGPAADQFIGRPAAETFPGQPAFAALLASSPEEHSEMELSRLGAPRAFEVQAAVLKDLRGNEAGRYLILRDISQRRQAQEALEISYQRYSTFMKSLPDPVVVYDMEGRVQYLNPAFEETFGWTSEELLNKRIDFVPPQCRKETDEAIQVLQSGRQLLNFSSKRLTKDGRLLDVNLSNSPFYDAQGRQAGNIVILRDVTALNRAQAQLRESEERYRTLVENTPYGLFLADPASGRFIFLNRQLSDMLGYGPDETEGLTIWEVIDRSEHELAQKCLAVRGKGKAIDSGQVFTGRRKDGSLIRCLASSSLVSSGGRHALQGIVRDVTNEELMERQLQQAQKMEAVGTLAGGVAHEFNNLLMAIRGYSQLATSRPDLEPEVRGHLEKIAQTAERAADLTQTMLSFSRPETGRKEPVDLNETMRNVRKLLLRTLPPNIEQRLELTPRLPLLKANPNQLEQVLLNLAVNARDAMPHGGRLTLRTAWRRADEAFRATHSWATEEEYGVLAVEDNGQGMARSVQARVFEPFYTTKEPGKGSGLGLFVAYSIIANHGGGLEVISAPRAGAAFRVYLPAEPGQGETPAPPPEPPTPALGRGERILVVDDEASLRDIARQALESFNYRVGEAANGREALGLYRDNLGTDSAFALVLMDMAMPVMDGAACFNRILALDPGAKVIITTGHLHSNACLEQLSAKPAGLIRKPFDLSDLLKEIRQALDAPRP